jgi:hypothetical protein
MKKVKWDKNGPYAYCGIAKHAETNQYMIIYHDITNIEVMGINLAAPFDGYSFSRKGMPRNRRFELVEK